MNVDAPETQVFENLMAAMYQKHPIREPILGTRASIGEITPQTLYDCHKAYYRPENMILCVVADADPEEIFRMAEQATAQMPCPQVTLDTCWQESAACEQHRVSVQMEVARPMFQLGFKCNDFGTGAEAAYWEFVGDLAAEALFGESSPLYLQMYEQGLIDPTFAGGLDIVPGMALLTATGDSDDPEAVMQAILKQAEKIAAEGIPEADFLRMKRSTLGGKIRGLDSFDSTCFRVCAYQFTGFNYFRFPEIYETVTAEDVRRFVIENVTPERCCLSVVAPKEEDEC